MQNEPTRAQKLAINRLKRAIKNMADNNMIVGTSVHNSLFIYDKETRSDYANGIIEDEDEAVLEELSL